MSVQFSCSVMSDSLWPHGLQHTRLPRPSPTPRACWNLCVLSRWRHPISSSSAVPFSSRLPSFPASGSFPMSQLFTSGGQSIGASASVSASVPPMNTQNRFPLGLTGLIALQSKGLSRVFYNTTVRKHQFFSAHLQNTFLCILHLFPFRIFPLPRPSAVCLFALFMELIWWTDRPSSFQYVQFIFCVLCAVEVVVLLVFWQTFSVVCKCRFPTFSLKCA